MLFNHVRESIFKNKQIKDNGGYVGIPFPLKKLSKFYPVIERGHSIGVLGGTGTGKSRFARFLGIYTCYEFYKKTGYKTRIFYFPLEDNKEKVYKSILCHYLNVVHNIYISLQELDSKGDRSLPPFIVDAINEGEEYFRDFEKIVTVLDGYTEPVQIYNVMKHYALKTGKIVKYNVEIEGSIQVQKRYESDIHTIIVLDNMSNLEKEEQHKDERAAIVEMGKIMVRERFCNFFKFSVIQLLQLDFQSERQQFTSAGKAVMSKVEPTLAGIGDAKTIARSMHIIFSLFNPSAYGFIRYPQLGDQKADKAYDIDILANRFRAVRILKNNDGDMGMVVGVLMDAIGENFEELPRPDEPEITAIYNKINKENPDKFIRSKDAILFKEDFEEDPF